MKMSKQTGQVLVLAVLMVALVAFGIMQFSSSSGTKPPPPSQTAKGDEATAAKKDNTAKKANDKKAAKGKAGAAVISWVNQDEVPTLVKKTKGGRNPFKNLILYEKKNGTDDRTVAKPSRDTSKEPPFDNPRFIDPVTNMHTRTVYLEWITPQQVAGTMRDAGLAIMLRSGKNPQSIVIEGESPDFENALALINRINVPPPPPPFQLSGVMLTPGTRYAAIGLHGNVYTVLEGEPVPSTDWTVLTISPTTVTLKKGKQSVSLRLAGGSPS